MKIFRKLILFICAVFVMHSAEPVYASSLNVMKEGNVSDNLINLAIQQLDTYVPEAVQRVLKNKGWNVYVTTDNIDQKYFFGAYGSVSGVAVANSSTKGSFVAVENREKAVLNSVVHELGHAVDYELGYVSKTSEFQRIFSIERSRFVPTVGIDAAHATSSSQEYYASAFDEYFRNPGNLSARAPLTYNYIASTIVTFASSNVMQSIQSLQNGWQQDANGWWYVSNGNRLRNTWFKDKGAWYYFNNAGYMTTGWQYVNGVWYYMYQSGAMATGWINDRGTWYYLDSSGAMKTGWVYTGNKWYYLNGSGAMHTGWLNDRGVWYYLGSSGAMVTGWQSINGVRYHFNASGALDS